MRLSPRFEKFLIIAPLVLAAAALVIVVAVRLTGGRHGLFEEPHAGAVPSWLLPGLAVLLLVDAVVMAAIAWRVRRGRGGGPGPSLAPGDLKQAAEVQAERAGAVIDQVGDPARRAELAHELAEIEAERAGELSQLDVVVFGTVSAGKTSLINALLGREAGTTEAVMGTTRQGQHYTHELKAGNATVRLTDTPGMSEAAIGGDLREAEARALAVRADLLLFVVDHDLIRSEYEPLIELARLGKRSIVVLNKKDRFPDADLDAILRKLRERLAGVVDRQDIVAAAAAPLPLPIRLVHADGSVQTDYEREEPDISAFRSRLGKVLRREGKFLHAANLLVRGKVLEREARDQLAHEREVKALKVVEHHQWITAGTVFTSPIPALDVLAGGAVQFDMITELARVYGHELNSGEVRILAGRMVQSLIKLGLIEAATSLIAGVFKRSLVGLAVGGSVQAVAMAYLTHVSGKAFIDYFRDGQSWGPEGINGVLLRQFDLNSRTEFLRDFTAQVVNSVLSKLPAVAAPSPAAVNQKEER